MTISTDAHRVRVKAMRIAHTLAAFDLGETKRIVGGFKSMDILTADMTKWPFIDLDPLLGATSEILRDDGARATWPIDFGICFPMGGTDFRAVYARSISTKEARMSGAQKYSTKMLRLESVDYIDGVYDWGAEIRSLVMGKWANACVNKPRLAVDCEGSQASDVGDILAGAALKHRYEWSAIFDFPTGISLRFGTTAQGALEIFKDRDMSLGEMRRASLLHWVRRHWRKGKSSPEAVSEIRRHLRGKEKLSWCGMDVAIIPAEYEIEQAA